ncbi:tetratricopeptide repeat-containing sensor histidine kinase [Flavobacterium sp.]|uniref:tetratricopeptide repeat-containing sensor histidine kinase n=1 Tax=Flavobacterium sp. TaxID=239 RepID=UPI00262A17C3|nr:tetratricopeptide repeat-containing sensor histidine kinase [Flavobacterium sp.]
MEKSKLAIFTKIKFVIPLFLGILFFSVLIYYIFSRFELLNSISSDRKKVELLSRLEDLNTTNEKRILDEAKELIINSSFDSLSGVIAFKIARKFYVNSDIHNFNKVLRILEKNVVPFESSSHSVHLSYLLGLRAQEDGDVMLAIKNLSFSAKRLDLIKDNKLKFQIALALSESLYEVNDYNSALQVLSKLKFVEASDVPKVYIFDWYNFSALVAIKLSELSLAKTYLEKAKIIAEERAEEGINDELYTVLNNLGLLAEEKGDFLEAKKKYESSLRLQETVPDVERNFTTRTNILLLKPLQKLTDEEIKFIKESMRFKVENNLYYFATNTMINLARIYNKQNRCDSARIFAKNAMDVSKKNEYLDLYAKAKQEYFCSTLGSLLERENYLETISVADSVQKKINRNRDAAAAIYLSYNEIVGENNRLNKKIDKFVLWSIVALFSSLILIVGYLLWNRFKPLPKFDPRKNRPKGTHVHIGVHSGVTIERSRIARELHDNVLGKMTGLKLALLKFSPSVPEDKRAKYVKKVKSLDVLNSEIRRSTSDQFRELSEAYGEISTVLHRFIEEFSEDVDFNIKLHIDDEVNLDALNPLVKVHTYRIVQELLTNTLKYAKANCVRLSLEATEDQKFIFSYGDDGKGFDFPKIPKPNKGLSNVLVRGNEISATFEINTGMGKGFHLRMVVPDAFINQNQTTINHEHQDFIY